MLAPTLLIKGKLLGDKRHKIGAFIFKFPFSQQFRYHFYFIRFVYETSSLETCGDELIARDFYATMLMRCFVCHLFELQCRVGNETHMKGKQYAKSSNHWLF